MSARAANERGFTVVETLVTVALFVALGFLTLGLLRALLGASAASATAAGGALTLERELDDLRSDAATAFAVFVPATDVMQRPNAVGGAVPHEVDFYTKTDAGAATYWAYYYDASAETLQRFDYDAAGHRGEADRTTGAIDTTAAYPVLPGVTSFAVQTLEANDLVGPNNAYAAAVAPLFGASTPQPLPVGFDDGGPPRTDLYGGNVTVQLTIGTAHASRTIHLATAALPSGFTVHAYPQIRAIVYREDQTHRFWFGLAGKSHVFVNARLDISYDGWKTQPPAVWCDFNVYGYPGGLTGGAAEDYHPDWFTESTAGIVYAVTHGNTPGATCSQAPPPPGSGPPVAFTPPPDISDTPPPCFLAGQCWPLDAPPDWSPSPAPASSPPPAWCAGHAASTLCGGAGPPPLPTPIPTPTPTPVAPGAHPPTFAPGPPALPPRGGPEPLARGAISP